MERSLRQTSKGKFQRSNAPKSSEQSSGGKDIASAAYDEYLWLLQKRNRLLKRLKTKDEQQVELEKREQGFSVYINGANREFPNLPMSRRTKTADDHLSSRTLLTDEFPLNEKTKGTSRAKTAPTKLTRKEWKPVGFRIKTEQGDKINVNVPGKITGIYSEDFDELEDDNSESEASDISNEDSNSDHEVENLSLSFNDVHKLRRSLERDSKIQESIQTVIECDSFVESDEDKADTNDDKPLESLDIRDIEDNSEHESEDEIEEDIEVIDTSVDLRDGNALENIPQLRSSYVIYEDKTDETLRSRRPVIGQTETEEDTIVLSFSKSKPAKRLLSATRRSTEITEDGKKFEDKKPHEEQTTFNRVSSLQMEDDGRKMQTSTRTDISDLESSGPRASRPLSTTSRKKQESSFVLSSQVVLDAVTLENDEVESFQKNSTVAETKMDPLKNISDFERPITDQTVAMVTKKVRNMNASQQKQLLDLLVRLDPTVSQSVSAPPKVQPSIAFGSPISSPTQPLSPREDFGVTEAKPPANESCCLEVNFEIKSNWGHPSEVGLTEVQFFDCDGLLIDVPQDQISISSKRTSELPLTNLINGKTKTTNEKYMWKCPYTCGEIITLSFQVPAGKNNLSKIKVWNYNKKMKDLSVGVKEVKIFTSGSLVWDGIIDKGCGNQIYDYAEVIHVKRKEKSEFVEDTQEQDFDEVVKDDSTIPYRNDEPLSRDIIVESSDVISSRDRGPKPIFHSDKREIVNSPLDDNSEMLEEKHFSKTGTVELPRKPPWLDEIKGKRFTSNHSPFTYLQTPVNWLDTTDKEKDSQFSIVEEPGILDQPRARSRPSSGRRSSKTPMPDSPRRTTARPESGRRSVEQPQESLELHEQITKLCVGDVSPEDNPVEQERWLEESLNSLSQFKRCHQGRITPSNKIEMDRQGDALDDLLRPDRQMHGEQESDMNNPSFDDDFIIPELPRGQRLVINILSTWGDHYYVGLNGIEVFSSAGKPVQILKITADPSDINILPEYNKDPRVVSNLIDGVYVTRDDMHLWLAPFTEGKGHFIYIDFKEVSILAMIRIWNYNKSRIHSFRGAKDIEICLDDSLIFRGEMARASGELGSSETFGDTILFTMNEEILEAMAANDQTYEADVDEDEDFLQTSNSFKRPVTADTGIEAEALERPYTCPKERRKPTVESTFPNKVLEDVPDGVDGYSENFCGQVLELNFVATWGDMYYLGLTGLQLLGSQGEVIDLIFEMLQAWPKDLNDLPEYDDDDRTLDKLIDGVNITMSDEHMWLIPFTPGENHLLTVTLKQPLEITGLRVWNYNKSPESTYRGVKRIIVKLDGRIVGGKEGILIRKGPGHCHFDFGQDISFLNPPRKPEVKQRDKEAGDCELTVKPCGFVFQFQLFGSWGDPYYLGLNGLQFFDEHGGMIELSQKNVTAYPESVNVLEGVKDDVRTPAKLIDGVNDTDDGRHMWLTPVFPGLTNLLYVIFDEPTTISMIKLWNYRKTPIRGVRQFSILVDDLLVFNGILPQVPTVTRGILPNMDLPVPHAAILFTDDETMRRKEKSFVINGGGFFESQEVCLMNDKTDFQQEKTTSKDPDQAMRPKTSVTHLARTRR